MRIIHLDMDAFFAACEVKRNPSLKGKPVVIGADPKEGKGRGVVSTCSYEARTYGISSAMPISQAYRLCPSAVFLPVDFAYYWRISERVMQIARSNADAFQQTSIDEAFLDVSGRCASFTDAEDAARATKRRIAEEDLTCSIGIGPNKLVAKMASDFQKPDGLTTVEPHRVQAFLFPLPVRKLYGVGKKTEYALRTMGIETIGDLAAGDVQSLQQSFGRWGAVLHQYANGIDDSAVEEAEGIQSLGREITFDEDTNDVLLLHETIDELAADLHHIAEKEKIAFRTVTIKVRFENFETHTRQKTLPHSATGRDTIGRTAKELLSKFTESKKKIRLIGVKLSNLHFEETQKTLMEY